MVNGYTNSVSFNYCNILGHKRTRYSPDRLNTIEECGECFGAWQIGGITGEVVQLPATWTARVFAKTCTHNSMVERKNDQEYAWQCADCGYVYGQSSTV